MDVDSTLIQQEVIELLAAYAGKREEVTAVTEAAMRGELDFAQSLHARVAVLAGLPADVVDSVRAEVTLSDGAAELVAAFKAAGTPWRSSRAASTSPAPDCGGPGAGLLECQRAGNFRRALTGKVVGDVVDRAAKEKYLREWAAAEGIPMETHHRGGRRRQRPGHARRRGDWRRVQRQTSRPRRGRRGHQHALPGCGPAHRRGLRPGRREAGGRLNAGCTRRQGP